MGVFMEKDELLLLEASVDAWIRGYDSALDDFSKKQKQLSVADLIKKCRKDVLEMLQQTRYIVRD